MTTLDDMMPQTPDVNRERLETLKKLFPDLKHLLGDKLIAF